MTDRPFSTPGAAFLGGVRDYAGISAIAMIAAFIGFGAIVRDVGLDIWQAMATTAGMTLIPAQLVMVELYQTGAALAGILLAVGFIAARLLPMTVSLMPLLAAGNRRRWQLYAGAHLLASMAWTHVMRRGPSLPTDQRMAYYLGVAGANYAVIIVFTAVGFHLAGGLPVEVVRGLVYLTPLFFLLLFIGEIRDAAVALSLALGAGLGPAIYSVNPELAVLGCGLIGGTMGFAIGQLRRRRHG